MKRNICFVLTLFIVCLTIESKGQATYNFPVEISTGSLKAANIDSSKLVAMTNEISSGGDNIHSILIIRDNKLLYEKYFSGKDELFGVPLGETDHTRDSLHDCRSLTKSIVSACIGIAVAQHKIKSVNDRVFIYLPEYTIYDIGMKHNISVKDLLTMSAGLEWNENIPYSDPMNSEIQMLMQNDVVDFVLSRPGIAKPGTIWNYSAGCTQLLAEILKKVTGEKIDSFAKKNIFDPLGIKDFYWYEREDGTPWAPSGLRLRSVDIAKFGLLYLNEGKWDDTEIIPSDWVQQSLTWQINTRNESQGYGYQFWCTNGTIANKEVRISMAIGFGGQRIYLIPELSLAIVITAGNYNEHTDLSDELVSKYIFPAIEK